MNALLNRKFWSNLNLIFDWEQLNLLTRNYRTLEGKFKFLNRSYARLLSFELTQLSVN